MNPIILSFADGTTFFVGLALVLVAETLFIRFRNRIARPVLTVLALVGMILVVISATPLPIWVYLLWTIPAVAGLVLSNRAFPPRKIQIVSGSVLLAATAALCIAEAPHHRCPSLVVPDGTTVYVLGDSISAGMGTKHRCWPAVLDGMTPLRVVNLAQPGATVESAIAQAKGIDEQGSLVIVEIGGNDLLGGTDASAFRSKLDILVSSLRGDKHQVLLLELPLFPFQNAYGEAHRDVAAKHGAAMLPKRCFAAVLGTENATLDGLHLSQAGHDAMAAIIADVIKQK
jgi:acyl-CoA thioesterase-1